MKKLTVVLFTVVSLTAAAQGQANPTPAPRRAPAQQVTFDESDLVEGRLARGEGDVVTVRPGTRFKSLIRVRDNFNEKLRESVNEL